MKKEDLQENDLSNILLKIQKIRSGGKLDAKKAYKQVGIDQFEKNLIQRIEMEREKERLRML